MGWYPLCLSPKLIRTTLVGLKAKEVNVAQGRSTDLNSVTSSGGAIAVAVSGGDQKPVIYTKPIATVPGLMNLHQLKVGLVFLVVGLHCPRCIPHCMLVCQAGEWLVDPR